MPPYVFCQFLHTYIGSLPFSHTHSHSSKGNTENFIGILLQKVKNCLRTFKASNMLMFFRRRLRLLSMQMSEFHSDWSQAEQTVNKLGDTLQTLTIILFERHLHLDFDNYTLWKITSVVPLLGTFKWIYKMNTERTMLSQSLNDNRNCQALHRVGVMMISVFLNTHTYNVYYILKMLCMQHIQENN